MNDLKFTTAGEYIKDQQERPYYINESGVKIDAETGDLYVEEDNAQCLPP